MAGIDARVARLATHQHGVVAARQCLVLGMARRQIEHRVASGRWARLHAGVYAVGHAALTPQGRYLAAVLACGPSAVAAYRTAASLHGLQPHHGGWPHVLSPVKHRRRRGITGHWTRSLSPADVTVRQRVPVTTLARTLIDLADIAGADEYEEALRAAERLHAFDRRHLRPVNGRRGSRRILQDHALLRGELERLFRRLVADAGFPEPRWNAGFGQYDIDALWPDAGVAVEIDDYATHLNRDAFDRDRVRDRVLAAAGLVPVRVTHTDLTVGRALLEAHLRALGVG